MEQELILYFLLAVIAVSGIHLLIKKLRIHYNILHTYIFIGLVLQGFLIYNTLITKPLNLHNLYTEMFLTLITINLI